eukprot:NODE_105_length_19280_cov_0.929461.p11 type:complete len:215 gc:universal NODE_105_length_19280_cov_0.929461:6988-6344(-)
MINFEGFSFAIMTVCCWLAYWLDLSLFIQHGKVLKQPNQFHVPKSYFLHFYFATVLYMFYRFDYNALNILFLVHVTRRLIENYFMLYSTSMFIGHYIIGFVHYYLAICSLSTEKSKSYSIGAFIFVFFMLLQSICHIQLILAKKKSNSHKKLGFFFKTFYCPHYAFEIYMYFGLFLFHCNTTTFLMFLWVFSNLTISMLQLSKESKYYLVPGLF